MWRTFRLRTCEDGWDVTVDLTAWCVELPDAPSEAIPAGERTWLDVSQVRLAPEDVEQLRWGLTAVAPAIEAGRPDRHVLIDVIDVQYHQPQGMAAAIIGWAAEEFSFIPPAVDTAEPLVAAEHPGSTAFDALPGPRDGEIGPAAIEAGHGDPSAPVAGAGYPTYADQGVSPGPDPTDQGGHGSPNRALYPAPNNSADNSTYNSGYGHSYGPAGPVTPLVW
jgi:hypothetical protein